MKNYVDWQFITANGENVATNFINLAKLDATDTKIILDRKDRKKTQYATAMELGCSTRHINNRINALITLYEKIQKKYPDMLPELNKQEYNSFINNCEYKNVSALVGIDYNGKVYTIKIENGFFNTFNEIRLFVIDELNRQYKIVIDELDEYTTYITGKYNLKRA